MFATQRKMAKATKGESTHTTSKSLEAAKFTYVGLAFLPCVKSCHEFSISAGK
jgi:hypothetical protein